MSTAEVVCPECGIITSQPVGTKCPEGCDRLMVPFENGTGKRKKKGFGGMSPEKQHEIASKGGRAAHAKGTAHQWTPGKHGTAAAAGSKGGRISRGGRGRLIDGSVEQLREEHHAQVIADISSKE